MEQPDDGLAEATDQFLSVPEAVLDQIVRLNPSGEQMLGRFGAGGMGFERDELDELYRILEVAWDRAQGEAAAEILRSPDLSSDLSKKAKQVARRLRKKMEQDPTLTVLDAMMHFVSTVGDQSGSISILAE